MTTGRLDTSVLIGWHDQLMITALPDESAISAISLAELASGPHLARSREEAARRQARVQEVEATFEPIPFDAAATRSYGLVTAAVAAAGRSHRRGLADLLIAATAVAHGVDLYPGTRATSPGLRLLLRIVTV